MERSVYGVRRGGILRGLFGATAASAFVVSGALVIGCAGDRDGLDSGGATLRAQDFRVPRAGAPGGADADNAPASDRRAVSRGEPDGPSSRPARASASYRIIDARAASEGLDDVVVLTGDPVLAPRAAGTENDAGAAQRPVPLDSLVGQINGRAVYAQEFLAPLEGRLRALDARERPLSEGEWNDAAKAIVGRTLYQRVLDELILAEARASLTPQERQGLRHFLNHLQENLVSLYRGSESYAEQQLLEEEGVTLDQKARDQLELELIAIHLERKVRSRVFVSWREIQLEYERRYDEFNPYPVAHLRMIWVNADDAESIERVERELGEGRPFEEVASMRANLYRRAHGGEYTKTLETRNYQTETLFALEELDLAAKRLSPGETTGPVPFRSGERLAWIRLDRIEQPPRRSLEDAQLEIMNTLRNRKLNQEQAKYFQRLLEAGSTTDLELMADRLVDLAAQWYRDERR